MLEYFANGVHWKVLEYFAHVVLWKEIVNNFDEISLVSMQKNMP